MVCPLPQISELDYTLIYLGREKVMNLEVMCKCSPELAIPTAIRQHHKLRVYCFQGFITYMYT